MNHSKTGTGVKIWLFGICICVMIGLVFLSTARGVGTDNNHLDCPTGVALNSAGDVFIADQANHRIQNFDKDAHYLSTIGESGVSGNDIDHFNNPYAVAVNSSGYLYISDGGNARVQVFNSAGVYQFTIGQAGVPGSSNNQFDGNSGIAVNSSGYLFVADFNNHRVQVFNQAGVYQYTIGQAGVPGSNNAHFDHPEGVAVNSTGYIFVADKDNNRVQVFNNRGIYQFTIGETGIYGADNAHFSGPKAVAINATGYIYISDSYNNRVQIYDKTGKYQFTLAITTEYRFIEPRGIAIKQDTGQVYIAVYGQDIVEVFDSNRAFLYSIGEPRISAPTDWHLFLAVVAGILVGILVMAATITIRPPLKEPEPSKISKILDRDAPHWGWLIWLFVISIGLPFLEIIVGGFGFYDLSYFLGDSVFFFIIFVGIGFLIRYIRKRLQHRAENPLDLTRLTFEEGVPFWKRELKSLMFLGILGGGYTLFIIITSFSNLIIWDFPTIILSIIIAIAVVYYYFTRWPDLEQRAARRLARGAVQDFSPPSTPPVVTAEDLSIAFGIKFARPEFVNQPPRWQWQAGIYYKWYQKYQLWKIAPVVLFGIVYFLSGFNDIPFLATLGSEDLPIFLYYTFIILTALAGVLIYLALRKRARDYVRAVKVNALFESLFADLLLRAKSRRVVDLEEVCRDHGFTYTTFLQKIPDVKYPPFYEVGDLDLPTGRFLLKSQYATPIKFEEFIAKDLQNEISASGQINLTKFCQKHRLDFRTIQNLLYQYAGKNQFKGNAGITKTGDYLVTFEQGADPQVIANLDQFLRTTLADELTGAGKKEGGKV